MARRSSRLGFALGLLVLGLLAYWEIVVDGRGIGRQAEAPEPAIGSAPRAESVGSGEIERLFQERRSEVVVETAGVVEKVLPDDRDGSRHQRFILRLASGHSVLVAHNIDLAPRVAALERGDAVTVRGQYEWNERGGVLHWTHRDPQGARPGGWIRHDGRTYR